MKVFLDTNVLVSAFATRGLCSDLLRLVLATHELVLGEVVLEEMSRALRTKLRVADPIVHSIETLLRSFHVEPTPKEAPPVSVRDASDRRVLVSALKTGAEVLITGDDDLLTIAGQVSGIRILDPRSFWEEVSTPKDGPAS